MTNLDDYSFYASIVTGQAFVFKNLIDLLTTNVRNEGHFKLARNGIHISSNDNDVTVLIRADFPRENFNVYKCEKEIYIGTNLGSLQNAMKTVKRKERMALYIRKDTPSKLGIEICPLKHEPMEHQKIQRFHIIIHIVNKIEYCIEDADKHYHHPIVIKSSNYQSVCKTINNISRTLSIRIRDSRFINFSADGEQIINAELSFGNEDHEPERPELDESQDYCKEFETTRLNSIIKLTSMTNQIQIYAPKDDRYPLRFGIQAGQLGTVEVFLKDRKSIEDEKQNIKTSTTTVGKTSSGKRENSSHSNPSYSKQTKK